MEFLPQTVAREQAEQRLADREQQVATAANRVADIGVHLMNQVEALTAQQIRQDRRDAKRKADQARQEQEQAACEEQAEILQYLAEHPEPGAETDDTHHPLEEPGIGGASYPEPDPEDLGGPKDPKHVPQPVAVSLW
jgi:hypothetical protein